MYCEIGMIILVLWISFVGGVLLIDLGIFCRNYINETKISYFSIKGLDWFIENTLHKNIAVWLFIVVSLSILEILWLPLLLFLAGYGILKLLRSVMRIKKDIKKLKVGE